MSLPEQIPDFSGERKFRAPLHPGALIKLRLFDPLGVSQKAFCEAHDLSETTFSRVLNGRQDITADTAIKLSKAFKLSEMFFMNLQSQHALALEKRNG